MSKIYGLSEIAQRIACQHCSGIVKGKRQHEHSQVWGRLDTMFHCQVQQYTLNMEANPLFVALSGVKVNLGLRKAGHQI